MKRLLPRSMVQSKLNFVLAVRAGCFWTFELNNEVHLVLDELFMAWMQLPELEE